MGVMAIVSSDYCGWLLNGVVVVVGCCGWCCCCCCSSSSSSFCALVAVLAFVRALFVVAVIVDGC